MEHIAVKTPSGMGRVQGIDRGEVVVEMDSMYIVGFKPNDVEFLGREEETVTTDEMISDRKEEIRVLTAWMRSLAATDAPSQVWVAVQKQIHFCRDRVELLEKGGGI